MPEPWRTSLLLLARITLEQKGSSKRFHSCLLLPRYYCLAPHIQPSVAVKSNYFKKMTKKPLQQPYICDQYFLISKYGPCIFIKEQKENQGSHLPLSTPFLLVFFFYSSDLQIFGVPDFSHSLGENWMLQLGYNIWGNLTGTGCKGCSAC